MQVTDTALFSPGFIHALAARLAADTAMTLTESSKLEEKMEVRYEILLPWYLKTFEQLTHQCVKHPQFHLMP